MYKLKVHRAGYNLAMDELKDRLKALRQEKGWSREDLAQKVGVTQSAIAHIESGRNQGSKHLPKIAKVLETPLEYLLHGSTDLNIPFPKAVVRTDLVPLLTYNQVMNAEAVDPDSQQPQVSCPVSISTNGFAMTQFADTMVSQNPNAPSYPEGTIVFFDTQFEGDGSGKRVLVQIGDRRMFRDLLREGDTCYLKPLNNQYPTTQAPSDVIQVLAVCVGAFHPEP